MNMEKCIENSVKCRTICLETIAYCLEQGGKHVEKGHLAALLNCVESCQLSGDFMITKSAFHMKACGLCAEVCDSCAKSCDQFANDEKMKKCAEACRQCALTCHEMCKM
jgi:hypothetical protein